MGNDPSKPRNGEPLRFVFWGILRPSADWVWDWVAQGWPKGHPSVAQGRPKRGFKEVLCLQQKLKKWRGGGGRRDRTRSKAISPLINPDGCGAGIKVKSQKS